MNNILNQSGEDTGCKVEHGCKVVMRGKVFSPVKEEEQNMKEERFSPVKEEEQDTEEEKDFDIEKEQDFCLPSSSIKEEDFYPLW